MRAKLGRPRIKERPEGYESACAKVLANEVSMKTAAEECGCSYVWFSRLFKRDYPDFKPKTDWQKLSAHEVGKANQKYASWLASYIDDKDLCEFIRSKGKCDVCPKHCTKNRKVKGLGDAITETRVLIESLKAPEKPLEEK